MSSYGSYWLFKEDHDRLHRCRQQLQDTRYANLLADTVTKDGRVFVYRDGELWAALYEEVPKRRSLPRIVSADDVQNLAEEMARFHQACREVARLVPPTSTSIKADAIHLLDLLSDPATAGRFPYDEEEQAIIRTHCETFLDQLDALGYDDWVKIPVLIDWNLGNFSVDYHGDRFRLYSRWDYDWFRMDPRTLDFYFLSRVSSRTGDRTVFTYGPHTFVEPRFQMFLAAYHRVYPLRPNEVLFLREVYRFFILNYVIRQGYAFFQPDLAVPAAEGGGGVLPPGGRRARPRPPPGDRGLRRRPGPQCSGCPPAPSRALAASGAGVPSGRLDEVVEGVDQAAELREAVAGEGEADALLVERVPLASPRPTAALQRSMRPRRHRWPKRSFSSASWASSGACRTRITSWSPT